MNHKISGNSFQTPTFLFAKYMAPGRPTGLQNSLTINTSVLWKLKKICGSCVYLQHQKLFIMGIVYKLRLLSCYRCHDSSAWMKLHWFREALQIVSVCSSLFARTEPEKYEAQTASLNSVLNNPYIVLQITQCSWISYCSRLQHSRVIFHLAWVLYRF